MLNKKRIWIVNKDGVCLFVFFIILDPPLLGEVEEKEKTSTETGKSSVL